MIRSTQHSIKFCNYLKKDNLYRLLIEYKRVGDLIIENIWENGYEKFNVKNDVLDFPKYLDYNKFDFVDTNLSARILSSLVTQVSGVIRASIEKRRRLLWLRDKLKNENKSTEAVDKKLTSKKFSCTKPNFKGFMELSSKNMDIKDGEIHFDKFIRLKSIGKDYGFIKIPIQLTKQDLKWNKKGKLLGSILVSSDSISLRYEVKNKLSSNGNIVGCDQGMKTIVTLSDGQTTPTNDNHNHSLESIIKKLSKKKKGSKAFLKAQDHRKNFINWSINQLNLSNIKEIRLEEIKNINFGKRTSRKMQAWTNTIIRDKLKRFAEEHEVHVILQSSIYRSQRCCKCGNVKKSNRKGKEYKCKNCGNTMDADLNAAKNHEVNLKPIPVEFCCHKLNRKSGFLWNPDGLFNLDGSELRVPDYRKSKIPVDKNL